MARCTAGVSTAAVVFFTVNASAGGFYLTDRGVRALGRGGAFVAGADDQGAVWYNPAGLTAAGNGILFDASVVLFGNRYTRTAQPAGGMETTFPTVNGSAPPLPLPTIVVSHNFGLRNWMFAAGILAPYAAIASYSNAADAPQRYSLISLDGSLLTEVGLWAAWRPIPTLSIGLGVQALVGSFASQLAFSGCPATVTCAAEDPNWDAVAQLKVGPIFAPTGNVGVRWVPHPMIAFGASFQAPVVVSAPATLAVRLPSEAYYDGAQVQGQNANVGFSLAPIARVGVEVRPIPSTRIELAGVWEGWHVHDQISLTPENISLANVRGVGTYQVGPVAIARNFQDVWSIRLGTEYETPIGRGWSLAARAGMQYETSATTPAYTSVMTMDAEKFVGSLGASVRYGPMRVDMVYAHMFASSVVVDPRDAALYQTAPFRANNPPMVAINGGTYDLSVDVFGLGMQYTF